MKLVPLLAVLLLAACGRGDEGADGERKTAAGEVLGGSISDDMLPLDTVTSQSPPLKESAEPDADEVDGATAPARDTAGGPGEPPRDPAPTATPVAEEPEEPAE